MRDGQSRKVTLVLLNAMEMEGWVARQGETFILTEAGARLMEGERVTCSCIPVTSS